VSVVDQVQVARVPVGFTPSRNRLVGPLATLKIGVAHGSSNLLDWATFHERSVERPRKRGAVRAVSRGRSFRHSSNRRPKRSARYKTSGGKLKRKIPPSHRLPPPRSRFAIFPNQFISGLPTGTSLSPRNLLLGLEPQSRPWPGANHVKRHTRLNSLNNAVKFAFTRLVAVGVCARSNMMASIMLSTANPAPDRYQNRLLNARLPGSNRVRPPRYESRRASVGQVSLTRISSNTQRQPEIHAHPAP
jgi:hypothetical protein